tara:strand:- start:1624 stop:1818 length:195 start_codon:yes stop_codon:yes gene_type:complete
MIVEELYKILILINAEENNWNINKIDKNKFYLIKKKNGNINKELKLLLKKPHDLNEIINKKFNK